MKLEMTGGEAIARIFQAANIGPIFGMGGFQTLPFYDATRRLNMPHHLINDERAAVFIADAYSKASNGRVGAADATLGPGATNLVTGLVEALNAGTPMVVIVGDTHRDHSCKNMTQESDQIAILKPACKAVIRIEKISRIPELMKRAFAVATSGRPGPVVVDVPEDIAHDTCEFDEAEFSIAAHYQAAPALRVRPDVQSLAAAAALLRGARKPILLAGGGVHLSNAHEALTAFSRAFNIPVAHTLTGKGAIACTDPLSAGLFGRYDRIANGLIDEADVVIVAGCKLGEIATKRYTVPGPGKCLIHIDNVAEEFGRTLEPTVALWGDVRATLEELDTLIRPQQAEMAARLGSWAAQVPARMAKWREEVGPRLHSEEVPINMARLITELNHVLPEDGILIADGGFAAHWGGLLFDTKAAGRRFIPDRGFASIGYGLPGAMGAALAQPSVPVFALTGDGGFNMMLGELETARRLGLNFSVLVVNNAASGYIKALQHLLYGPEGYHASDLAETNYAKIAEAMGVNGLRLEKPEDIRATLQKAMTLKGPTVIDVVVTRDASKMLPGVDNRAVKMKKGDRVA